MYYQKKNLKLNSVNTYHQKSKLFYKSFHLHKNIKFFFFVITNHNTTCALGVLEDYPVWYRRPNFQLVDLNKYLGGCGTFYRNI